MAIKATGTITENMGDGKLMRVNWNAPETTPREWYFHTFLLTIQRVIAGEDWKRDGLIEFAFEGNPQNIERFLDDPRWRERRNRRRGTFGCHGVVQTSNSGDARRAG